MRYVDPNGKWFWEASHIRQARKVARKTDGEFKKWKGQDGRRYASVTYKTTSQGTGSTSTDGEGNATVTTDETNVTSQVFKPGQKRWDALDNAGLGVYEKMRATTSGLEYVKAIAKSGDAWAAGTTAEYDRGGQAPGVLKTIAGLNPLVSVPNAIKVLSHSEDIYGSEANTKIDKGMAATELAIGGGFGVARTFGVLKKASETTKSLMNAGDVTNKGIQGINDGGLLDEVKKEVE